VSGEAVFVNAFGLSFAHRLPVENQAIRVVDDAIGDGIGEGRIADDLMPGIDRNLTDYKLSLTPCIRRLYRL
jgi:hypothetical protein